MADEKAIRFEPARQALVDTLLPRLSAGLRQPETVDVGGLFDTPPKDLWMEIGFGAGEHLAHQASQYPNIGLIGVEPLCKWRCRLVSHNQSQ